MAMRNPYDETFDDAGGRDNEPDCECRGDCLCPRIWAASAEPQTPVQLALLRRQQAAIHRFLNGGGER